MRTTLSVLLLGLVLVTRGSLALSADGRPDYPPVTPGTALQFPEDYGTHPAYRTEWWYLTGWLHTDTGAPLGFQVTFFRSRPPLDERNPSHFTPRQLLFAHAALADPRLGHLLYDQRAARAGFGLAQTATGNTRVQVDRWTLVRRPDGTYQSHVPARDFTLDLAFTPTQPPLLEGEAGFSRKGPAPNQASGYYSVPQLAVTGTVMRDGKRIKVSGTAWLDHEWASEILARDAVGWDWAGINLQDGGAVMAFSIRNEAGQSLWAGGSWRQANGQTTIFQPTDIAFTPEHSWRSPRTGVTYPVGMQLRAGTLKLTLEPLMNDQELDTRISTGAVYWEGAAKAQQDGKTVGHGYLELTGYFHALDF